MIEQYNKFERILRKRNPKLYYNRKSKVGIALGIFFWQHYLYSVLPAKLLHTGKIVTKLFRDRVQGLSCT